MPALPPKPSRRAARHEKAMNIALQGGGSHGAFTWGVLDKLFEDDRIWVEAISGASAGAMNAVVAAQGMYDDGAQGARKDAQRGLTQRQGIDERAEIVTDDDVGQRETLRVRRSIAHDRDARPVQRRRELVAREPAARRRRDDQVIVETQRRQRVGKAVVRGARLV